MPSRRRRRSKPKVDRISPLPDSLLCHILSFLPTEDAVTTSVLSKRWRPLWRSVLTLDFNDERWFEFSDFSCFVYSVIFSRDPTLPLRSFRIRCGQSKNFDPLDLDRFIHAAVQRGIEIFDLNTYDKWLGSDTNKLVPGILRVLSCRTLVVLKLANLELHSVPHLIDLPSLKTLHLEWVLFHTPFAHFLKFVQGCSLLEDLHIESVEVDNWCIDPKRKFGGFSKLVRAYIRNSEGSFPLVWLHNAKFLYAHLMMLYYGYDYQVLTFPNLTHMELYFESDYDDSLPGKWKLVQQVLHHCPMLQSLIMDEDSGYTTDMRKIEAIEDEDWKDPEIVPKCLTSQLRTCCLRNFKGYKCELHFAEYIILNSKLLCTMTIKSNSKLDGNAKQEPFVKLSSYPRGSATCKLLFD